MGLFGIIKNMENQNKHRPRHIYLEDKIYFVTGRTYNKINYFSTKERKNIFIEILNNLIKRYKINIYA